MNERHLETHDEPTAATAKRAERKLARVVFEDDQHAEQGLAVLHELERQGVLTLRADAVIVKGMDGHVSVRRSLGPGPNTTFLGALLGSLLGVHAGPFGLLVGACSGALLGAAIDLSWVGVGDDAIAAISERLVAGEAAVLAELGVRDESRLNAAKGMLHGVVRWRQTSDPRDQGGIARQSVQKGATP